MEPVDSARKLARLREILAVHAPRLAGSVVVIDEGEARFRSISAT
jgi:hypothetical protein